MMAKSLYYNTATPQSGGGEVMEYTSGEKIPVYTKVALLVVRGENYSSTRGLTIGSPRISSCLALVKSHSKLGK